MSGLQKACCVAALLISCQRRTVAPDRTVPQIAGMVIGSNGSPAGDVRVAITGLESESRIALTRTDAGGEFRADALEASYALALTSAREFAFVERVAMPAASLKISLSADCKPITGRLVCRENCDYLTSTVVLERRSTFTGDAFPIAVARDGSFATCLPSGKYVATVQGTTTMIAMPVVIPAPGPLSLEVYPLSAVEAAPPAESFSAATFDDMVKALAHRANVLGFGEANHGTADFYALRGALALALARSGDLRHVMIEADAIGMLQVDDYVQGGDVPIEKAVAALKFWVTDIKEFLQFLRDVRGFNRDLAPSHRLHVLGMDAQFLAPAAQLLLSEQTALSLTADEQGVLTKIISAEDNNLSRLAPVEKQVLEALLGRVIRLPHEAEPNTLSPSARAIIAASSLQHQLEHSRNAANMSWDKIMADMTILVWQLAGRGRMSVWAHNGHIARKPVGSADSTGGYLAEHFGSEYYPIAFLSYDGSARAWGVQNRGVVPHSLGPTPRYNLESVVMAALGFPAVAWVRFDASSAALQKWLAIPRYVREFGSTYVASETQTLRQLPQSFDATVVVSHASASTPTPTGERGPQ